MPYFSPLIVISILGKNHKTQGHKSDECGGLYFCIIGVQKKNVRDDSAPTIPLN